jgi:DNA transposition AAA+ family ATPase
MTSGTNLAGLRNSGNSRVADKFHYSGGIGVHRIDLPFIAVLDDVLKDDKAQLIRLRRCPDNRHRLRTEKRLIQHYDFL